MSATWGVEVNESAVWATQMGAGWWTTYRRIHERSGRITAIAGGFMGELVEVACEDQHHARWLAGHMVEQGGLPKSAVRARRIAAPGSAGAA